MSVAGDAMPDFEQQPRRLSIDCASMIAAGPASWSAIVDWLQTLPMCQEVVELHRRVEVTEDEGEPLMVVGVDRRPIDPQKPPPDLFYVYDNEAEIRQRFGPITRRLLTAWTAASYRFTSRKGYGDRYFDFGLNDAKKIALLGALTFNADFTGTVVGLDMPWEHPADSQANFEGRAAASLFISCSNGGEPEVARLMSTAIDYLERMATVPPPSPLSSAAPNTIASATMPEPAPGPDKQISETDGPVSKLDGWTRTELIAQAKALDALCSPSTFDNIRKAAGIPPAEIGGAGAQRRFSVAHLRKLIAAAEAGNYRSGKEIARCWRELLPKP